MWLYLQWGPLGPVDHLTVEQNYHNVSNAGGCASPEHADTCKASGFCPTHYPPATCGGTSVVDNVLVNGSAWPPEARDIMAAAGPHSYGGRSDP